MSSESQEKPPAKRQRQTTLFAHFSSTELSSGVRELESHEETSGNFSEPEAVGQTGGISIDHDKSEDDHKDIVPTNPGTCQGVCCRLRNQKGAFPAQRQGHNPENVSEVGSGHFHHTGTKNTRGSPCARLQGKSGAGTAPGWSKPVLRQWQREPTMRSQKQDLTIGKER
jgi:hypothetical protein